MAATILQDKGQIAMLTVVTPGVLAPQSHPIGCIKPTAGVQRICWPPSNAWLPPIAAPPAFLNPNPPMDTDGRREDSGRGVRELQAR